MTGGCDERNAPPPIRTEPWRVDTTSAQETAGQKHRFEVAPDQQLQFSLKGSRAEPVGRLEGISGQVDVSLHDLAQTRGKLSVDLRRISILNEQEANTPSFTGEALRWLGLGHRAPSETEYRYAEFTLDGLHTLSHETPYSGSIRSRDDGAKGQVRRVSAEVRGKLQMRTFSVERSVPVWILFYYDQSATPELQPEKIVVELRGKLGVPLAEYEIVPRDDAGHVVSDQLTLLGQEVGKIARISGSLALRRSQVAKDGDSVAP